jgi:gliding motility-associated-like protein
MRFILIATLLVFSCFLLEAQVTPCTAPGQNPSTAFPVCGTSTFSQSSVPICGGRQVPAPTCNSYPLTDVNPFWYKFTCFQSGTLAFKIKPHTNSEDYDWQLFDITNQNPNAVYTNVNLAVACNWSGESGETGASAAGTNLFVCEGFGKPLWSKMPNLAQGHEYLLLVSHFTQTQSGYDLSFGGGTAVITDSKQPRLDYAVASCGGDVIRVKLNKKMKCNSIAINGSDFYVTPGNVPVIGATAINCNNGFDTDSVELKLGSFLAPGTYELNMQKGSDANTILDYCDNAVPETDKASFSVYPIVPTPMDSLAPLQCKPQSLRLIFKKPMLCSTVAPDGSDFMISGAYPVTISGAAGKCSNGATVSNEIIINLSQPLYQAGNFILTLRRGTDGNTIFDECGQETPAGSSISFSVKDTVNADFTYQVNYGCTTDTISYFHPGANGVNSWKWNLDENKSSTQQNPEALYQQFNLKTIQLVVSNGFCSDTSSQSILLDNFLKADFSTYEDVCPNEPTQFTSTAQGRILSHSWDFGDGGTSSEASPSHTYSGPLTTTAYQVRYTVTDSFGCSKTVQQAVRVYSSCYLAVPTAFTPNNDGKNDYLYPLNAIKAEKLDFRVYNRWGQLIFQTNNWKKGWDGTFRGVQQASGIYVWFLTYVDRDTKQSRQMKGTAALIR